MSLVTPQSCDAWRRKASVILRPSGIIRAYHPYGSTSLIPLKSRLLQRHAPM
jgi:hypothetical protein